MHLTKKLLELDAASGVSFGFEFFCPDSEDGFQNLRPRIDRLASTEPLFVDVVSVGGLEAALQALRLCRYAKKVDGVLALMHLSCADMTVADTRTLLDEAKAKGVDNVLVERGVPIQSPAAMSDHKLSAALAERPPFRQHPGGFLHTSELVAFIRREYGSHFCVGVMGYPSGRGEYGSYEEDLAQMRAKADSGADFVLAQHVNDAKTYLSFQDDLLKIGVRLPVIPCVMPVLSFESFLQLNHYCGVPIPPATLAGLHSLQDDNKAVREYGNRLVVQIAQELMNAGVNTILFHTLNLEAVIRNVLQDLGLCGPGASSRRKLPWRPSGDECRACEDVRPIFWANRPASYVERTAGWEHFPSGRWTGGVGGGQASRAFTDVAPDLMIPPTPATCEERRSMWGEMPAHQQDVWETFARYVEGRVPRLPWCEVTLHPETSTISTLLARLNRAGFLTINSQPRVNGARSDDQTFGWGGPGGYVYQKAYVECFASPTNLAALMEACLSHPSVSFQAVDAQGNTYSNSKTRGAQAVTWGVFPAKEIIQPTVVDPDAFLDWKKEAFALWLSEWAPVYDDDSVSCDLIYEIHDSYFLVNLVDNDFVKGDIFKVFEEAMARLAKHTASAGSHFRPSTGVGTQPSAASTARFDIAPPPTAGSRGHGSTLSMSAQLSLH